VVVDLDNPLAENERRTMAGRRVEPHAGVGDSFPVIRLWRSSGLKTCLDVTNLPNQSGSECAGARFEDARIFMFARRTLTFLPAAWSGDCNELGKAGRADWIVVHS